MLFVLRLSRTTLLPCVLTLFHTEEKEKNKTNCAEEQWSLDEVASKTQQKTQHNENSIYKINISFCKSAFESAYDILKQL